MQRRNCHHLVLFKNPKDQQQIMALASQIYPGKWCYFMHRFNEATQKPYGYMVVNLTPTAPETHRMLANVIYKNVLRAHNRWKINKSSYFHTCKTETCETNVIIGTEQQHTPNYLTRHLDENMDSEEDVANMRSCDDCVLVFSDVWDLERTSKHGVPIACNVTEVLFPS